MGYLRHEMKYKTNSQEHLQGMWLCPSSLRANKDIGVFLARFDSKYLDDLFLLHQYQSHIIIKI